MLTCSMLFSLIPWQRASTQVMHTEVPGVNVRFRFIKRLKAAFNLHVMAVAEIEVAALLSDRLQ